MEYINALFIKFVMMTIVLWLILGGLFGISFAGIAMTIVLLTVVSFLIGDLFILPRFGIMAATIADFGLALIGVWVLGSYLFEQPVSLEIASFISAIVIAVGELLFHMYMKKQVLTVHPEKA